MNNSDSVASLSALTDEQLAIAYINGNNSAFDLLLERNKTKLFLVHTFCGTQP